MDKFNILKIDLKTEEETRGSKSKYWSLVNDKSALIKINNIKGKIQDLGMFLKSYILKYQNI